VLLVEPDRLAARENTAMHKTFVCTTTMSVLQTRTVRTDIIVLRQVSVPCNRHVPSTTTVQAVIIALITLVSRALPVDPARLVRQENTATRKTFVCTTTTSVLQTRIVPQGTPVSMDCVPFLPLPRRLARPVRHAPRPSRRRRPVP